MSDEWIMIGCPVYQRTNVVSFCKRHYTSSRMRLCEVPGCDRKHVAKGLCSLHRQRLASNGTLGTKNRKPGEGTLLDTGYWADFKPTHPLARKNGRVLRHRALLYDKIGPGSHCCHWCAALVNWTTGQLAKRDSPLIADHKNGDKQDNSFDNLVPSCMDCNIRRRWPVHELRQQLLAMIPRLDKNDRTTIRDVVAHLDRRCLIKGGV